MANRPVLHVATRTIVGRRVKSLRRQGKVPAHIFGKTSPSISVEFEAKAFERLFAEVGETTLIDVQVSGEPKARPILVTSVDRHPLTGSILHVDLHQVSLTEKVTAHIPVEITGNAAAVTDLGGVLVTALSEVEIEALPTDLPENIRVDISKLVNVGDSLQVKDLGIDESKLTILTDLEETVVTVQPPASEEEVAPVEAPTEAETTVQGKPEESENPSPDTKAS